MDSLFRIDELKGNRRCTDHKTRSEPIKVTVSDIVEKTLKKNTSSNTLFSELTPHRFILFANRITSANVRFRKQEKKIISIPNTSNYPRSVNFYTYISRKILVS